MRELLVSVRVYHSGHQPSLATCVYFPVAAKNKLCRVKPTSYAMPTGYRYRATKAP